MNNLHEEIKKANEVLQSGGVILYPTDTIWGIGCDATNADAVKRVYAIKQRSDSKSMLVLLDNPVKLNYYVGDTPDIAMDLIDLSEKPLTIIFSGARNVAENLIAEDGSLGIRITNEEFSRNLCRQFRKPIVSTSANISGEKAPATFQEISDKIKQSVDYIVEYRQKEQAKNNASSIVKLAKSGTIEIIRK